MAYFLYFFRFSRVLALFLCNAPVDYMFTWPLIQQTRTYWALSLVLRNAYTTRSSGIKYYTNTIKLHWMVVNLIKIGAGNLAFRWLLYSSGSVFTASASDTKNFWNTMEPYTHSAYMQNATGTNSILNTQNRNFNGQNQCNRICVTIPFVATQKGSQFLITASSYGKNILFLLFGYSMHKLNAMDNFKCNSQGNQFVQLIY